MSFPQDLVQLEVAWCRTYDALAAPRPAGRTALRRRLLVLSARLWCHPFWTGPGRMPAARLELRRRARAASARG
ncbi:hypothetical protein ACFWJM_22960 [Streptomyces sp. NPDC127077]|uniref:hypothetical protein n=1 Tax=Streptomyces sp. NPDC127077 TaxID=3347131 RepID=UPI00365E7345